MISRAKMIAGTMLTWNSLEHVVYQLGWFRTVVVLEIHQTALVQLASKGNGDCDSHVHKEVEEAEGDSHEQSRKELVLFFLFYHFDLIVLAGTVLVFITLQLREVFRAQLVSVLVDDTRPCQIIRYRYVRQ